MGKKFFVLIVLLAVGIWMLGDFNRTNQQPVATDLFPELIEDFHSGKLRSVSFSHPGEVFSITCNKQNTLSCNISDLPGATVDITKLQSLLMRLDSLQVVDSITDKAALADRHPFGLSVASLKVEIQQDKRTIIYFGNKNPVTGRRYISIEGVPAIYIAEDNDFASLLATKNSLRINRPLSELTKSLDSLTATSNSEKHQFVKTDGLWKLEGSTVDLDSKLFSELLTNIAQVTVSTFIDTPDAKLLNKLHSPELILDLTSGSETKRLSFYSFTETNSAALIERSHILTIAGSQTFYEILPPRLSDLSKPAIFFQQRRPFALLEHEHLKNVALTQDGKEVLLDNTQLRELEAGSQLLSQLRALALLTPTEVKTTVKTPSLRISFTAIDGKQASLALLEQVGSEQQSDAALAPYLVEIRYFSGVTLHAIISHTDAKNITTATLQLLNTK